MCVLRQPGFTNPSGRQKLHTHTHTHLCLRQDIKIYPEHQRLYFMNTNIEHRSSQDMSKSSHIEPVTNELLHFSILRYIIMKFLKLFPSIYTCTSFTLILQGKLQTHFVCVKPIVSITSICLLT